MTPLNRIFAALCGEIAQWANARACHALWVRLAGIVPEGHWKLAGGANHRFRANNDRKPRQGLRKSSNVIPSPLPGLTTLCMPNRWLAPPAAMGSVKRGVCLRLLIAVSSLHWFGFEAFPLHGCRRSWLFLQRSLLSAEECQLFVGFNSFSQFDHSCQEEERAAQSNYRSVFTPAGGPSLRRSKVFSLKLNLNFLLLLSYAFTLSRPVLAQFCAQSRFAINRPPGDAPLLAFLRIAMHRALLRHAAPRRGPHRRKATYSGWKRSIRHASSHHHSTQPWNTVFGDRS